MQRKVSLLVYALCSLALVLAEPEGVRTAKWINEGHATLVKGPANEETLQFVQLLWRHGDRTPANLIPTDKDNDEKSWPEGLGELTVAGMAQHFRLGKFLRRRYKGFLGDKFLRNQMHIRSSDYNRTLMSAQGNMAGFFPPNAHEQFEESLAWQPVPIHTIPREEDIQLYEEVKCPTAEAEYKRIFDEFPQAKKIEEQEKDLLKFLNEKTKMTEPFDQPLPLKDFWKVYDPLHAEFCHNDTHHWPKWMNASLYSHIIRVYDDSSRFNFHTELLRRLRGGPLVHEVLARFAEKAACNATTCEKLYAYSAHDTTLAAILATLGIFPTRFPLYATALMIEMHKVRDGLNIIQLFHKNETDSEKLFQLEIDGCSRPCTLEKLREAMKPFDPTNWKKECGLEEDGPHIGRYIAAVGVLSLVSTLLALFIAVDVFLKYRRRGSSTDGDNDRLLVTEDDNA